MAFVSSMTELSRVGHGATGLDAGNKRYANGTDLAFGFREGHGSIVPSATSVEFQPKQGEVRT